MASERRNRHLYWALALAVMVAASCISIPRMADVEEDWIRVTVFAEMVLAGFVLRRQGGSPEAADGFLAIVPMVWLGGILFRMNPAVVNCLIAAGLILAVAVGLVRHSRAAHS
jgi:hypothetical protein